VKQILLTMNEKESFIIDDLDDYHIVIKADEEVRVRRELEVEVTGVFFFNSSCTHLTLFSLRKTRIV
jgi:hypothetical protein